MKKSYALIACVIVLSALLSSCEPGGLLGPKYTPTPDPCSPSEVTKYYDMIKAAAQKFDDASQLANSTPRMSLPPQISELQSARREADALVVPYCATKAQTALVDYMNEIIDGFTAFLGQESDSVVQGHFTTAETRLSLYQLELDKMISK